MTILLYDLVGRDENRPFSPHCWKSRMALAHKGLEHRSAPTRFVEIPVIENGLSKTVPIIRDGEKAIADSFAIALYLDEAYPDRPTLFAGEAMARFIERWSQLTLHPYIGVAAMMDEYWMLDKESAAYFRRSREARFGRSLEAVAAERDAKLAGFRASLQPLRSMLSYQSFLGGQSPLFADYIVFGALQWARVTTPFRLLDAGDSISVWFERCLDLHGDLGRMAKAA
jgi:glutathione S-transferase